MATEVIKRYKGGDEVLMKYRGGAKFNGIIFNFFKKSSEIE